MAGAIDEDKIVQFFVALNPHEVLKFSNSDDGWVHQVEQQISTTIRTQQYGSIRFTYPVNLPGQEIPDRPDTSGILSFRALAVRTRLCDIGATTFASREA